MAKRMVPPISRPVPYRRTRRWLFVLLVIATTVLGATMMYDILGAGGVSALEIGILLLFVPTFGWISVAFWNAVIGFALQLVRIDPNWLTRKRATVEQGVPIARRTALAIPARHEDPEFLIGGIRAMVESLQSTGEAQHFDVHLLSDTSDPGHADREEIAWRLLLAEAPRPELLHYRRRAENVGRKAGNIADFCAESGDAYDYMIILDADSVMSGETLVRMVRAMDADPAAGLIQTVPVPCRQQTLFGRLVQFASAVYSPMLATGQAFWQTDSANYWGHNAILRMRPFIEHCRLPVLPGRPPLGGPVLSHDFVEAALLRRAGWRVWLEPSLAESWEGVPANVPDYAERDRRWAQGSLQHLRLLTMRGLAPLSRIHFGFGAMGYLSSALWLLLLLVSTLYVLAPEVSSWAAFDGGADWLTGWSGRVREALPLLAVTAIVLFVPKLLGLALALTRRGAFGSRAALIVSGLIEAFFAVLVAPLMMMYHTGFVLSVLLGRDVEWAAQVREDRAIGWREAAHRTAPITALGAAWAGVTLYYSPPFFLWLTPIFAGLLLAAPIARWSSSARLGRWLRKRGLLLAPSEVAVPSEAPAVTARHQPGGEAYTYSLPRSLTTLSSTPRMHQIERGLFELRRGRPLLITSRQQARQQVLFTAVEGLDTRKLNELRALGEGSPRLVVTPLRAKAMGVESDFIERAVTGISLSVNGSQPAQLFAMASAIGKLDAEALGARPTREEEAAALAMIRLSGLVPAAVTIAADPTRNAGLHAALDGRAILSVDSDEVLTAAQGDRGGIKITHVSNARVPLEDAEDARFMLFREANGLLEHVAILFGERASWPSIVPVRLHSACLTGDLFGSLRCDCGEQLRGSMRFFSEAGGGVLLYLQQEGRGIGLGNKLRAYALQEQGLDTVDADRILGFEADERRYDGAVQMLRHLEIERVKLLTNNPDKVTALENGGVQVVERRPLHGTLNDHNRRYVHAKVHRAGHWLHDMLQGAFPQG